VDKLDCMASLLVAGSGSTQRQHKDEEDTSLDCQNTGGTL